MKKLPKSQDLLYVLRSGKLDVNVEQRSYRAETVTCADKNLGKRNYF